MQNFKSFILQEASVTSKKRDLLISEIKASGMLTKCSQFLQANKEAILQGKFLRRQTGDEAKHITDGQNQLLFYKKIRTNRRPRDTRYTIHEYLDSFFKDEFGTRYRSNALFCKPSSNFKENDYGHNIITVFPVNGYKMCASPIIEDLSLSVDCNLSSSAIALLENFIYKNAKTYFSNAALIRGVSQDMTSIIQFHYFEDKAHAKNLVRDATQILKALKSNTPYHNIDVDSRALLIPIIKAAKIESGAQFDALVKTIIADYLKSMKYQESQTYSGFKPKNEVMIHATGYFALPNSRALKDIFAELL